MCEWCKTFAYFEHIQIVWELGPMKIFAQDSENIGFFFARRHFSHYGAPDIPVYILVATYRRLDGERRMHHESKRAWTIQKLEFWNLFLWQNIWNSTKNLHLRKFPTVRYLFNLPLIFLISWLSGLASQLDFLLEFGEEEWKCAVCPDYLLIWCGVLAILLWPPVWRSGNSNKGISHWGIAFLVVGKVFLLSSSNRQVVQYGHWC